MGHRSLTSCYLLGPICCGPESSCWKSQRLRIGSQTRSIFRRANARLDPKKRERPQSLGPLGHGEDLVY
jgi:hypothetical protein